ncbi:hypothetical protein BJ166DRAFT_597652 [Pestalotiopsis sp. NC0098]|nr:hypothetical protein BJ166DRAFT_597652 [Pestalotiopsis sp. NC0098]
MAGHPPAPGVQETPVPVPRPQILQQAQSHAAQPAGNAPAPSSSSSMTPLAGASAPTAADNKAAPIAAPPAPLSAAAIPPPSHQIMQTPGQLQAPPVARSASASAVQTPVPAPIRPLMSPAPAAGVPAPIPAPAPQIPAQVPTPIPTTQIGRPAPPAPSAQAAAKVVPPAQSVASNIAAQTAAPPRPPSPEIPVVEPLTPPLAPVRFPPPRQSHTYLNHPVEQTTIAPPDPEPMDFDNNPDALALKSTMAILQIQSAKSKRDMIALQKAKEAALADPLAFIKDLEEGKVQMGGSGLMSSLNHDSDDSDSSSSDDDDAEVEPMDLTGKDEQGKGVTKNDSKAARPQKKPKPPRKPWSQLPSKQSVARTPAINWSQYAVVGESLDKLHNEQVARPSQGTAATLGADGTYVFHGPGRQEEVSGISAPFDPLKDHLTEKPKPKTLGRQG